MYYGIEVVARPVDQWGIEELREFIGRNGEYLVGLKDTKPECIDFSELEKIGRDFEMVAGKLNEIVNVDGLEEQVEKLQSEVWNLEDADCDNCVVLEDELSSMEKEVKEREDTIIGLEGDISYLQERIAELEEQLANREE